jgi:hypothetical protein
MKRLEPCAGKLARTVLRGLGISNDPRLPDYTRKKVISERWFGAETPKDGWV